MLKAAAAGRQWPSGTCRHEEGVPAAVQKSLKHMAVEPGH